MTRSETTETFRHEALLYASESEFVAEATAFIRGGVAAGDSVMVVVSAAKIERLRANLDGDAASVCFADMAEVGHNPARIIPAWRDFVSEHGGRSRCPRGIGEPIWPGRSGAEFVECQHHETLLNVAFADAPEWWLLCPYDTARLEDDVIDAAHRSHPFVRRGGVQRESAVYCGLEHAAAAPLEAPLPEPPGEPSVFAFDLHRLDQLRRFVSGHAVRAGLDATRAQETVLAVHEVASNSVRHGGGAGTLRVWHVEAALICEVRDSGRIHDPLVGRRRPDPEQANGRGLWLANQLCDLVQVRSLPTASVVRLHTRAA